MMKKRGGVGELSGATTIMEVLAIRSALHPNRIAYTFIGGEGECAIDLTYGSLHARAVAIAAKISGRFLANEKAGGGKTALLMYPPGLDFIIGFFGCLYAGVIAVPIYPPRSNRNLQRVLSVVGDAQPAFALTCSKLEEKIRSFFGENASLRFLPLVATDGITESFVDGPADVPGKANDALPIIDPASIAMLQYTSGSTAEPKGVMLTHTCILASQESIRLSAQHDESMTMASWLPIYHDMGLFGGLLQSLYVGGRTCFTSPTSFLQNPALWLEIISKYAATDMVGPNFGYALCSQRDGVLSVDLSTIRTAWNGAEPIRASVLEAFTEKFRLHGWMHEKHFPCYGMAEATLMVTAHRRGEPPRIIHVDPKALEQGRAVMASDNGNASPIVSCGITHDATRIVIVDPATLIPAPDGHVGEIWISGPGVGAGYWRKPEETESTFRATTADGDGPYLRTGDLGFLHERELYVTGRLKDMVIIRGRNIYPQDIERRIEQLLTFTGPNSVAVFAWDDGSEERLAAVIEADRTLVRDARNEAERVIRFPALFANIRHAVMDDFDVALPTIVFVRPGTFARTSSGKVQRSLSRRNLLDHTLDVVAAEGLPEKSAREVAPSPEGASLESIIEAIVLQWLNRERGTNQVKLDENISFASIGIDSLGGAQIAVEIGKATGLRCSPEELYDHQSVQGLAGYLERHGVATPSPSTRAPGSAGMAPSLRAASGNKEDTTANADVPSIGKQDGQKFQSLEKRSDGPRDLLARYRERNQRAERWRAEGRYLFAPEITEQSNTWIVADGKRMLVLGSYGYLGLLKQQRLNDSAKEAIDTFGTGHHGVRLLAGTTLHHRSLERRLAVFMKAKDAIVYSSGYVTNVATITALVGAGDVVIGDMWNHASIIDGCRFSGAEFREFKHNDMSDLAEHLTRAGGRNILVVVDAVYSMEGDIANLPEIVALCRQHGALLMVDEAHSLGVLGRTGHGVQEHFGLPDDAIDVKMGTLSKALGSSGGFVAGKVDLVSYLRHHARGYIFSGALPVAEVVAARTALEVLEAEPERVTRLWANRDRFARGLKQLGFHTFGSQSPIVPIATYTEDQTLTMTHFCRNNGLFVVPVFYPAVPMNAPRLRTCVMASHTKEDLDFALEVLGRAGKVAGI